MKCFTTSFRVDLKSSVLGGLAKLPPDYSRPSQATTMVVNRTGVFVTAPPPPKVNHSMINNTVPFLPGIRLVFQMLHAFLTRHRTHQHSVQACLLTDEPITTKLMIFMCEK